MGEEGRVQVRRIAAKNKQTLNEMTNHELNLLQDDGWTIESVSIHLATVSSLSGAQSMMDAEPESEVWIVYRRPATS